MQRALLISALLISAIAVPAVAQQSQPRGYNSPARFNSGGGMSQYGYFDFQSRLAQQALTARAIAKREPAERIARAERIAALIDAGQCSEAEQAATSDGDGQMAVRVRQVCVAKMKKAHEG